jgi:hypothetical protein
MLFPKSRLSLAKTYQGKTDSEGWLTLDLTALDLEGVNRVYIPMEDVRKAQERGDTASDRLKKARSLLGDWSTEESEA